MSTPRKPRHARDLEGAPSRRRASTEPHRSITGSSHDGRKGPVQAPGRRTRLVSALAAAGVFATVLASQTVHGQPPHRRQRSTAPAPVEIESATHSSRATAAPAARETAPQADEASPREQAEPVATAGELAPPLAAAAPGRRPASRRPAAEARTAEPDEPVRLAMRSVVAPAADAPTVDAASDDPPEPSTDAPAVEADRGRRRTPAGKRTVITDDFLVEGKLEKPSAYYVLRRSSLDYDWARLDAKFSPLVLESVQDPLF